MCVVSVSFLTTLDLFVFLPAFFFKVSHQLFLNASDLIAKAHT